MWPSLTGASSNRNEFQMTGPADGVQVIKVQGEFSPEAMVNFRNRLTEMMEAGCFQVVLDLEVGYISERGLGLILEGWTWLRRQGGALKLATGDSEVGTRFRDFGLDRWVERYASVGDALESPWPKEKASGLMPQA